MSLRDKWHRAASTFVLTLLCSGAGAQELALLELTIDGRSTRRVEEFQLHAGQALARRAVWRELGVRDDPNANAEELVSATQLRGVTAMLDLERRTLALALPPDPKALTVIDRGAPGDAPALDQGSGALLNYDLTHQRSRQRHLAAGHLGGRWFTPSGVLDHAVLVSNTPGARLRRLDTTYTRANPQLLERLRGGDLLTGGVAWSRTVRVAGVQWATDFSTRPDLVTSPTPQLSGAAAVPSTVDVLVNGVRQLSEPVPAGRFEVRQLPIVNGLGEVSVVVRDALGRESVQSLSFYGANTQLARGISAYAFDAGLIRRGYATDQDRYRGAAASATWRHGATDAVTVEGHAEATRGTLVSGAGANVNLGSLGLVGAALAGSLGDGQRGVLTRISVERQTPALNLQLSAQGATHGYRDLATAAGDPPLRSSVRVAAGWQLGAMGSLGVVAVNQRMGASATAPSQRSALVSATYSRSLPMGMQVFVNGYRDLAGKGSHGASVGLVLPLGGRGAASTMFTRDSSGSRFSAAAGAAATSTGEIGWRVQGDSAQGAGAPARQMAQVSYLAPAARLTAELEQQRGHGAWRVSTQGAVLALGGRLHATQWVNDSVAVVDVDGQPGVAVYHQNRRIGQTDAHGQIVVPGLLSFQSNKIAIEAVDLPMDAEPLTLAQVLRPADRSGLHVKFQLDRQRSALVLLRDALGGPLPLGASVSSADTAAEPAVVGHDGQAYLRGLREQNLLVVDMGRSRCTARFAWSERDMDTGRIGPVVCQ